MCGSGIQGVGISGCRVQGFRGLGLKVSTLRRRDQDSYPGFKV